jgi:hypothetical protein
MRMHAALLVFTLAHQVVAGEMKLDSLEGLELRNVKAELVTHRGKTAVRLLESTSESSVETMAILSTADFGDGVIEAEIAALPREGASQGARGFAGIAFRVQNESKYECFYLRPTNGRANDQLRRNHSTQYISHPDYPWHRLRRENPGVYESYVDLEPGEWTKVRIEVSGTQARLFVHGAAQPALIVNDLKMGPLRGKIALWIGEGTEASFRNVKWTSQPRGE